MSLLPSRSWWAKAAPAAITPAVTPSPTVDGRRLLKSGLGAGAGLIALSALSSAVSASRRRRGE